MEFKYGLGLEAVDLITNFKGIIVYRSEFLTGCNQYGLQSQMGEDNKHATEVLQIDESRIEVTGLGIASLFREVSPDELKPLKKSKKGKEKEEKTGGPQPKVKY